MSTDHRPNRSAPGREESAAGDEAQIKLRAARAGSSAAREQMADAAENARNAGLSDDEIAGTLGLDDSDEVDSLIDRGA